MIGNLYEYLGDHYIALFEGKMRLPSGAWINCVIYKHSQVESYYSIPKSEFLRDFKNLDTNEKVY